MKSQALLKEATVDASASPASSFPVLVVEDDNNLDSAISASLKLAGYPVQVAASGLRALQLLDRHLFGLVISDIQMGGMNGYDLLLALRQRQVQCPVVLVTAPGSVEKAVLAIKQGAVDYLVKPFQPRDLLAMVARHIRHERPPSTKFIAEAPQVRRLADLACRVARSDVTVMISGASGTGKDVLARLIHQRSPRANQPFVAINCATMPESRLESELFGYRRIGSTGTSQWAAGKFEQAQNGTLLLSEISELAPDLQSNLLQVLQEKEVGRPDSQTAIQLDVRVLATSSRNLMEEVAAGRFREDLFRWLNVVPMLLPSLHQRLEDILPLARHFLDIYCQQDRLLPFNPAAERALLEYRWPGNVRELERVIQRALVLCRGRWIETEDLQFEDPASAVKRPPAPVVATNFSRGKSLARFPREAICTPVSTS